MGEPITREEIERWRAAFAEMLAEDRDDAPGDFARLLAAAEATLSHPAALEAARAEGHEAGMRAARQEWGAADTRAGGTGIPWVTGTYGAVAWGGGDAQARAEERERCAKIADAASAGAPMGGEIWIASNIAASIRALGPRPSPEAEAPKESAAKWLAVNFRKRAQALRGAAKHGEDPAVWDAVAETYETAAGVAERWRPTPGAVESATPPAMTPDLRETKARLGAVLRNHADCYHSPEDDVRIEHRDLVAVCALLSDLAPAAQPEPSKKAMP